MPGIREGVVLEYKGTTDLGIGARVHAHGQLNRRADCPLAAIDHELISAISRIGVAAMTVVAQADLESGLGGVQSHQVVSV